MAVDKDMQELLAGKLCDWKVWDAVDEPRGYYRLAELILETVEPVPHLEKIAEVLTKYPDMGSILMDSLENGIRLRNMPAIHDLAEAIKGG